MKLLDKLIIGIALGSAAFFGYEKFTDHGTDAPTPIAASGFHVLFVNDAEHAASLPPEQATITSSDTVAQYCNSHCLKDGKQPGWRNLDVADDLKLAEPIWQSAMQNPHEPPPWMMVSDGRRGISRPLPKTLDETMTVLKKYGGK